MSDTVKFSKETDEFTGLSKLNSNLIKLSHFEITNQSLLTSEQALARNQYQIEHNLMIAKAKVGKADMDEAKRLDKSAVNINAFDLIYVEGENGQGTIALRVYTYLWENCIWPNWHDELPLIVDGNRLSLTSKTIAEHPTHMEFKIYELPIDVFSQLCNASEIKYSLRGKDSRFDGVMSGNYILVFKAFEQYCFGDENEGAKIVEKINAETVAENKKREAEEKEKLENSSLWTCFSCKAENSVPNDWDEFSCHSCGKVNSIERPKDLSDNEIIEHEGKVVELIRSNKVDDAIAYYATNFGYSKENAKERVKLLADKNGLGSVYKKHETKSLIIGFGIIAVVLFILFKACS